MLDLLHGRKAQFTLHFKVPSSKRRASLESMKLQEKCLLGTWGSPHWARGRAAQPHLRRPPPLPLPPGGRLAAGAEPGSRSILPVPRRAASERWEMSSGTSLVAFSFPAFADAHAITAGEISPQLLLCSRHSKPGCSGGPCDLCCADGKRSCAPVLFWVFLVGNCEKRSFASVLS